MVSQPDFVMPSPDFDIGVTSPDGTRLLVVECKGGTRAVASSAAQLRRNLLAHGLVAEAAYFMLAFWTGLYLWKKDAGESDPPVGTASVQQVLKDYLGTLADTDSSKQSEPLELAIASWLSDLASGVRIPDPKVDADRMLVDSGVYARLKNATVRAERPS